jgi:hypothetical protein
VHIRNLVWVLVAVAFLITVSTGSRAQTSGTLNLEAAELAAELIGGPVFSADGIEVGELVDLSMTDDGRVSVIRIMTAARLGLGSRVVEIPDGTFMTLRGAVVLDFPAECIEALPNALPDDKTEEN